MPIPAWRQETAKKRRIADKKNEPKKCDICGCELGCAKCKVEA